MALPTERKTEGVLLYGPDNNPLVKTASDSLASAYGVPMMGRDAVTGNATFLEGIQNTDFFLNTVAMTEEMSRTNRAGVLSIPSQTVSTRLRVLLKVPSNGTAMMLWGVYAYNAGGVIILPILANPTTTITSNQIVAENLRISATNTSPLVTTVNWDTSVSSMSGGRNVGAWVLGQNDTVLANVSMPLYVVEPGVTLGFDIVPATLGSQLSISFFISEYADTSL